MLAAGALTILVISTLGGLMIDYAWREAQWQEVRAGLGAAVATAESVAGIDSFDGEGTPWQDGRPR